MISMLWLASLVSLLAMVQAAPSGEDRRGSFALPEAAPADILTREVEYRDGEQELLGYYARPRGEGPFPVVVVVHAWRGHSAYVRQRAEMLAGMGYAAFALDMYGKGVYAADAGEARRRAGAFYADRDLLRRRFKAGYDAALSQEAADPRRTGAIGYCFGGTVVLEAARTGSRVGVRLDAVASFHGGLQFVDKPEDVSGTVLVCNGYDDPLVPHEQREAFKREMAECGADFVFIDYAGAVHSFTEPEAGERKEGASSAYHAEADLRSWRHMAALFREKLRPEADERRAGDALPSR